MQALPQVSPLSLTVFFCSCSSSAPPGTPIVALTPYNSRWTLHVRVTNKSAIKTWTNAKGEGKLFSMDLLDESG